MSSVNANILCTMVALSSICLVVSDGCERPAPISRLDCLLYCERRIGAGGPTYAEIDRLTALGPRASQKEIDRLVSVLERRDHYHYCRAIAAGVLFDLVKASGLQGCIDQRAVSVLFSEAVLLLDRDGAFDARVDSGRMTIRLLEDEELGAVTLGARPEMVVDGSVIALPKVELGGWMFIEIVCTVDGEILYGAENVDVLALYAVVSTERARTSLEISGRVRAPNGVSAPFRQVWGIDRWARGYAD